MRYAKAGGGTGRSADRHPGLWPQPQGVRWERGSEDNRSQRHPSFRQIISPTLPTSLSCSSNPCPRLRHLYAETQLPASYVASKFQDIEKQSEVNICATENSPIPPKNVGPLVRLHPAGRNGLPAPPKNRTTAPSLPGLPVGWPERPAAFRVSSTATSCSSQTVAL